MKFQLPTYEFLIDETEESGIKCVSIVGNPAFGSHAVFFEKQKPKYIALGDVKKQIIAGLALIPNVLVYRLDPETGEEYNGFFSIETIEKIVNKFHDEQQGKNVNLEHNPNVKVDAYLLEDFIVNTEARVQDLKEKGIEHPNIIGSWFTSYKIKDPEVFQKIINSGIDTIGFSVESYLQKVYSNFNKEFKNKLIDLKVKNKMKKANRTLKEKIIKLFTEVEFERELVPELAFEIEWTEVEKPVNKVNVDEKGNETMQPVGQGEFVTEAGIIVVDQASNLVEIRDLPAEPAGSPEVSTSGATSGDTAISGSTAIIGDQSAPQAQSNVETTTGKTETDNLAEYPWDTCIADQLAAGYDQTSAEKICGKIKSENASVEQARLAVDTDTTAKKGVEKSVLEIVGTNDGEYNILVKVEGGVVTSATAQSMVDLMLTKQQEIDTLKLSVQTLEAKMKEPITDPILGVEPKVLTQAEFSKLSPYQKIMYNKGLPY